MIFFTRQTQNWSHLLTLFMACVTLISTTSNSHAQNDNLISLPLILKKDSNFSPYTRYIDVAGLRILALDEVSEKLILDIAEIFAAMMSESKDIDNVQQKAFMNGLQKMRIFQRVGLIGPEHNNSFDCCPKSGPYQHNHVDFIWELPRNRDQQANEIVEHLLHTITTLGFFYHFDDDWRWDRENSALNVAMREAISKGYYDVSDYSSLKDDNRKYAMITAQEFAYWVIIAEWNLFDLLIGRPHGEFSLNSADKIKNELPLAHALFSQTVAKIITPPDKSLLEKWN